MCSSCCLYAAEMQVAAPGQGVLPWCVLDQAALFGCLVLQGQLVRRHTEATLASSQPVCQRRGGNVSVGRDVLVGGGGARCFPEGGLARMGLSFLLYFPVTWLALPCAAVRVEG